MTLEDNTRKMRYGSSRYGMSEKKEPEGKVPRKATEVPTTRTQLTLITKRARAPGPRPWWAPRSQLFSWSKR